MMQGKWCNSGIHTAFKKASLHLCNGLPILEHLLIRLLWHALATSTCSDRDSAPTRSLPLIESEFLVLLY